LDSDSRFLGFRSNFQNTTRWFLWIFGSCNVRALIVYVLSFNLHYRTLSLVYRIKRWYFGRSSCRFWPEIVILRCFWYVLAVVRLLCWFAMKRTQEPYQTVLIWGCNWFTGIRWSRRILEKSGHVLHDPDGDPVDPFVNPVLICFVRWLVSDICFWIFNFNFILLILKIRFIYFINWLINYLIN